MIEQINLDFKNNLDKNSYLCDDFAKRKDKEERNIQQ